MARNSEIPPDLCPLCGGKIVYEHVLTGLMWLHEPDGDFLCPEPSPWRKQAPEEDVPDTHDWHHATPTAGLTCRACGLAHKFWSGTECPEAPEESEG